MTKALETLADRRLSLLAPARRPADAALPQASVVLRKVVEGQFNRRFVVELADERAVECVLYRGDTLCVSSQVGCAVGCPFCASGRDGLVRHLTGEELLGQLRAVQELGACVRRVTVSGVGEPLHNVSAVHDFILACREQGVAPSLTTSGGPLGRLAQALHWPHNGLTVSVHAGTEPVRARVVPRGPALEPLFECLREHWDSLSRTRRRKLALAYLLLEGVNDSDQEVDAFAQRLEGLPGARVHLYAPNAVEGSPWGATTRARYEEVGERLRQRGLYVQLSSKARREANGGCGTLVMRRRSASSAPR